MYKKKYFVLIIVLFFVLLFSEEETRPKIGLVLSGGGAKGLAHVGVLKVIEEAGLEVDYITGTSMGSIIGGLYAIGYTADELEKLVLSQEWNDLLLDVINKRRISMEEKAQQAKYVATFPLKNYKIQLPSGLVTGQNVSALLSKLTISVHHINDFDDFIIPFRCIGTDIETGEVVVLKSGYLPDAIRASMSIPSAFTPVKLDDRLLVDGGLVRNLPAKEIIDMGAEIVIASDVGEGLYSEEELTSLVDIMRQAINFQGVRSTEKQRDLCDLIIDPDVDEYSILDFGFTDSLLARGEKGARKMLPELKAIAESMEHFPEQQKIIPMKAFDKLYVKSIKVNGLNKVWKNLVIGKLKIEENSWVTHEKIAEAVERLYGSLYFERVTYKIEPDVGGVRLIIRVIEKSNNYFNVGLHYNDDDNAAVLLNTTMRNWLLQGSKLSIDLKLSEHFSGAIEYFIHTGWKPGFGIKLRTWADDFEVTYYDYFESTMQANYDYRQRGAGIYLQTIFSNYFNMGVGIEKEYSRISTIIASFDDSDDLDSEYLNYLAFMNIDTENKAIYPTKGVNLKAEFKHITNELQIAADNEIEPIQRLFIRYQEIVEFHKRVAFYGNMSLGYIIGDEINPDYLFYLGGNYNFDDRFIPFLGLNRMEKFGKYAFAWQVGLQMELWEELFITLKGNIGKVTFDEFDTLFEKEDYINGFGTTFGLNTPIGPVEYTIMKGSTHPNLEQYISIGYRF